MEILTTGGFGDTPMDWKPPYGFLFDIFFPCFFHEFCWLPHSHFPTIFPTVHRDSERFSDVQVLTKGRVVVEQTHQRGLTAMQVSCRQRRTFDMEKLGIQGPKHSELSMIKSWNVLDGWQYIGYCWISKNPPTYNQRLRQNICGYPTKMDLHSNQSNLGTSPILHWTLRPNSDD